MHGDWQVLCREATSQSPAVLVTGGSTNLPALFTMDVHYQSTNIATKQKSPSFYI